MRAVESGSLVPSTKINGSLPFAPEENFRPGLVGRVCHEIWGEKADFTIAEFLNVSDRAVRDYFSGKVAIPALLLTRINAALTARPR